MRALLAVALIALLAGTANAQIGKGKQNAPPQQEPKREDLVKKRAEEKAYREALEKIPASNEKPDPWKTMR